MADRKIIHLDMDAFFASIEQRDNPSLRGKPLIVGGDPDKRGVVSTCSYEARRFGIHSAMPSARAKKLCPQAVFLYPRISYYREVSEHLREIFHRYTDLVEPLSLDEAFLDVSHRPSATLTAQELREAIRSELQLTGSAGVSYNKFIAKLASDIQKPDGLTVILPEQALDFLAALPVERFFGVGKVTAQKLKALGIHTGADLRARSLEELADRFGKMGTMLYHSARGIDERPVNPNRERKSIGKETTLAEDVADMGEMRGILRDIAQKLAASLEKHQVRGTTVTLKVRYRNFETVTRSHTFRAPLSDADTLLRVALQLLQETKAGSTAVRLLGISVSNFADKPIAPGELQLMLPLATRIQA